MNPICGFSRRGAYPAIHPPLAWPHSIAARPFAPRLNCTRLNLKSTPSPSQFVLEKIFPQASLFCYCFYIYLPANRWIGASHDALGYIYSQIYSKRCLTTQTPTHCCSTSSVISLAKLPKIGPEPAFCSRARHDQMVRIGLALSIQIGLAMANANTSNSVHRAAIKY